MKTQRLSPLTERLSNAVSSEKPAFAPFMTFPRLALWCVCHCVFFFLQQVAELFAPFLLVVGIGWALIPRVMGLVSHNMGNTDPQTQEVMQRITGTVPDHLQFGGHLLTAHGLVVDGFLLMALAAVSATLSALCARKL